MEFYKFKSSVHTGEAGGGGEWRKGERILVLKDSTENIQCSGRLQHQSGLHTSLKTNVHK